MLQAQSSKTGETALVVKLRFLGIFCGVFGLGLLRLSGAWFGLGPGLVLGFTWKSILFTHPCLRRTGIFIPIPSLGTIQIGLNRCGGNATLREGREGNRGIEGHVLIWRGF